MRLIDADKLLHQGYDYVVDGIAYDSCNKSMDIEDIPTVQAIPLDHIKQAREEIENIAWKSCSSKIVDGNRVKTELIDREDVLAILDRLITKSEEK